MALSFTKHYSIDKKVHNIEFLDIPVDQNEIKAFVCPFLIEKHKSVPIALKLSHRLTNFLTELNKTYIQPNDVKNGLPFLDHLHEPNEYHLGYSANNRGKAVSQSKAADIFMFLRGNKFAKKGMSITNQGHNVLLLVKGIGQDIMSDIICNIARDIFAEFTSDICAKHSISTTPTVIEYYDDKGKKWATKSVNLPMHGKRIILVPNLLMSGDRDYTSRYNWFVSSNYIADQLLSQQTPPPAKMVKQLKDGTRKAIIKEIYKQYRKPKQDLIDFVLQYPNSLDEFIEYAKQNYPELKLDHLK